MGSLIDDGAISAQTSTHLPEVKIEISPSSVSSVTTSSESQNYEDNATSSCMSVDFSEEAEEMKIVTKNGKFKTTYFELGLMLILSLHGLEVQARSRTPIKPGEGKNAKTTSNDKVAIKKELQKLERELLRLDVFTDEDHLQHKGNARESGLTYRKSDVIRAARHTILEQSEIIEGLATGGGSSS